MGAWIEIVYVYKYYCSFYVAPCVGAWIEIQICQQRNCNLSSLPAWERGLKYKGKLQAYAAVKAAPYTEA